jgi:transcriptional regulator with XRE-family HTH domain
MTQYQGDLKLNSHLNDDPEMILFERLEHLKQYLSFTMQILRENAGLTQAELAGHLGVKQSAISKLENPEKQHDLERVMRYLHALGAELVVGVRAGDTFYQVSDNLDTEITLAPAKDAGSTFQNETPDENLNEKPFMAREAIHAV